MTLIPPNTIRTTPQNHYLQINTDGTAATNATIGFTPTTFAGLVAGHVILRADTDVYAQNTETLLFGFGNGLEIGLNRAGTGTGLDFFVRVSGNATSVVTVDDIISHSAGAVWHEIRFYIDYNNTANIEISLDGVNQTAVLPTGIPPTTSTSVCSILENVQAGMKFAQMWCTLTPNDDTATFPTLAEWKNSSVMIARNTAGDNAVFYIGSRGQFLLSKAPTIYCQFLDDTNQTILNDSNGNTAAINGIDYTIIASNPIIIGSV